MADSLVLSLAGMIGTLVGGGLAGFLSLRSEHLRHQAQERQEERQSHRQEALQVMDLRLEHHRWRREHRREVYQEFAGKAQTARGASLDYHRSCLQGISDPVRIADLRSEGRKAHRDAVLTSYGVGLQGPEEVAALANDCIASLRDLLNCAEQHEARLSTELPTEEATAEMEERITIRYIGVQERLRTFIEAGRVALDQPMPSA